MVLLKIWSLFVLGQFLVNLFERGDLYNIFFSMLASISYVAFIMYK